MTSTYTEHVCFVEDTTVIYEFIVYTCVQQIIPDTASIVIWGFRLLAIHAVDALLWRLQCSTYTTLLFKCSLTSTRVSDLEWSLPLALAARSLLATSEL